MATQASQTSCGAGRSGLIWSRWSQAGCTSRRYRICDPRPRSAMTSRPALGRRMRGSCPKLAPMNDNGQGPRHRRPRLEHGTKPADAGDGASGGNGSSSTDPITVPTIEATAANARWRALLAEGGPILADGAMGTMLFGAGLQFGDPPEAWNVSNSEVVRRIHRGYLDAGSRIVMTNTFGGNRLRLRLHGLDPRVSELNRTAAILLRAEVDAAGGRALVAGDIGPTGEIMAPLGTLEED